MKSDKQQRARRSGVCLFGAVVSWIEAGVVRRVIDAEPIGLVGAPKNKTPPEAFRRVRRGVNQFFYKEYGMIIGSVHTKVKRKLAEILGERPADQARTRGPTAPWSIGASPSLSTDKSRQPLHRSFIQVLLWGQLSRRRAKEAREKAEKKRGGSGGNIDPCVYPTSRSRRRPASAQRFRRRFMPGNPGKSRAWAPALRVEVGRQGRRRRRSGVGWLRPPRGGPMMFSAHEPPPENRPDESRGVRRRVMLPGERYQHLP